MIRPTKPDDLAAILALAVAAEMFSVDETETLGQVLNDYFDSQLGENHRWLSDEEAGKLRGVVYYAPEMMADRVWNLYMIAVHPDYQGQGRGTALMRYVEQELQASSQRMLLVETSSLPKYDRTRTFYEKCGYEKEAHIRDFYAAGDHKVVFRKVLLPTPYSPLPTPHSPLPTPPPTPKP